MKLKLSISIVLVILLTLSVNVMGTRAGSDPGCTVTPYTSATVTYDNNPHTAAVNCAASGTIDVSGTTHTDAGTYNTDTWSFTPDDPGTYDNAGGTITDSIALADAACTIGDDYTVTYNGSPHGASGTCTGPGVNTSDLDLGASFTDVSGGTANWKFSNNNYNPQSGSVVITITTAPSTVTVTCAGSTSYTGSPVEPCSAVATGASLNQTLPVSYSDPHTDAGTTVTASAHYSPDTNHDSSDGSATFQISKADATINVVGYTGGYDGNAHGATTGTATGVKGEDLGSLLDVGGSFTDVPGGTADWTFAGNDNYNSASGGAAIVISKADATINVTGYTGGYDGNAHGATTGTATGVKGEDLGSLLGLGASFTNVPGGTADWTFAGNTDYNSASGGVDITISQADASCSATGYSGTYDHSSHSADVKCTGVKGETLSGVDVSGTANTDAGDYPGDPWTFSDPTGNYKSTGGTVHDHIDKAEADCSSIYASNASFSGVYDGNAHPSGTCTGVPGDDVSGSLTLPSVTDVPGGQVHWIFSNGNYKTQEEYWTIFISSADASCTVTPYTATYDGSSHTATGSCKGVKGEGLSTLDLSGTTNTDAGDYPGDAWTFTSSTKNYSNTSGTVHDSITKAASATVVTFEAGPYTYRGSAFTATAIVTGAGGLSQPVTVVYSGDCTNVTPGGCTATATFDENADYFGNTDTKTIAIDTEAASVSAVANSKTYGAVDPTLTYNTSGFVPADLSSIIFGVTRATGESVAGSPYLIMPSATGAILTNYTVTLNTANFTITPADANCTITPYNVTFDNNPHTATGSCTGVTGETLSAPVLTGTTHTNAGDYPGDAWTFTDSTGNYNNITNGTTHDSIAKATANCTVTPYTNVLYDGLSHTATFTCTGLSGTVNGTLTGTTHIPSGTYTDTWTFNSNNGNYTATGGPITDSIVGVTVTSCAPASTSTNTHTYNGSPWGLIITCTRTSPPGGNQQITLSSPTCTNAPSCTGLSWTTPPDVSPTKSGTGATITINKASSTINVNCPPSVPYTGLAQMPCTAAVTGAGGLNLPITLTSANYSNNTNAGTARVRNVTWAGDANHNAPNNGSGSFTINQVTANCSITPYNVVYDGANHNATISCTGIGGVNVPGSLSNATRHSAVNTYNDTWVFTSDDGNYTATGPITDIITQATPSCNITPYNVVYNGAAHTATFSCTGVGGATVNGSLGATTTHTVVGTYADNWTFTPTSGNYASVSGGPITDIITQASTTVKVTCPAFAFYTGQPIEPCVATWSTPGGLTGPLTTTYANNVNTGTATASAILVGDANLAGSSGSATFQITMPIPTCKITPYTVTYDGQAHTATGTCTGINGEDLTPGLDLSGTTHTNAGTYTDIWTFTDFTGDYIGISSTTTDTINKAAPFCTVIGYNVAHDGLAHTATGSCTGVNQETLSGLNLSHTTHTNNGDYPGDYYTFTDSTLNYNNITCPLIQCQLLHLSPNNVHDAIGVTSIAVCNVAEYNVTYDGNPHTATGSCTGTNGVPLVGTWVLPPAQTNVGYYDVFFQWSFTSPGYPTQSGTILLDSITRADPTCNVIGYNVLPDGQPHTATGSCTGVKGETLSGLDLSGTTHTLEGNYPTDPWTFPATTNYNSASGAVHDAIGTGYAVCTVTGYTVPYDGKPHTASYLCTGIENEILTGTLTGTTHTNIGTYNNDPWTFTDSTGTFTTSGTVNDSITKANATCVVNGYNVPPDGNPHTATGYCTGANGVTLPGLDLSQTVHTDVGTWNDPWTFTDATGNYKNISSTVSDIISNSAVTCTITQYVGFYDGLSHTATGSCTGLGGGSLDGLTFDRTYTDVPGGFVTWTFNNPSFPPIQSGKTSVVIKQAPSTVIMTCPASSPFTGSPVEPCSAVATSAGMSNQTLTVSYSSPHTDAGTTVTASATYSGDTNHAGSSGSTTFKIDKATSTVTVSCPSTAQTYTGSAIEPCTASYSTEDGLSGSLTPSYTNNTNVGTATASAHYGGDSNHDVSDGSATFEIGKAKSTVTVTCPSTPQTYTGSEIKPCTASYSTEDGLSGSLTPSYSNNINVGTASASASYLGDANHEPGSGSATFDIGKAPSTVAVTCPSTAQTYTGAAIEPCTAKATGVGMSDVTLTPTYTDNINVGTATALASWDGDANHEGSSGSATFDIGKATSTVTVTCPSTAQTYTGAAIEPCTAKATGVGMSDVTLTPTYADNINVGTATASASWDGDANHEGSDNSATFEIGKADPACTITPYTVTYDGNPHTATGACLGVKGESLSGLVLTGTTHTNAGDYTDGWTFTDVTGNYKDTSGTVHDSLAKADATCTITPYTITYDGNAHTASGACLGVKGETLNILYLNTTAHTLPGDYPVDAWTFIDATGNYKDTNGTVHDSIAKADAVCTFTPYSVNYDGHPHTATGSCTGVGSVQLSGLVLSATTHTNAGDYLSDAWTFTDVTGNYNNANGTVHDSIARADATCAVTPYAVTYDGSAHTATGSCTGVGGVNVNGLDLSATTHTNGGDYPSDAWTFTDANGNYKNTNGTVHDSIAKTDATCTVTGYTGIYDGANHGASGSCTGVGGVTLAGLNLGLVFDHVPGGNANWTFTNASYKDQNGSVAITINKAPSITTVTCPSSVPYTGSPLKPCSASATGAGGLNQPVTLYYTNNTNIGTAKADSTYYGDDNHTGSTGSKTFTITPATAPAIQGAGGEETSTAPLIPPTSTSPPKHKTDAGVGSDVKAAVLANGIQVSTAVPTLTAVAGIGSGQGAVAAPVEAAAGGKSKSPNLLATYSGLFGCIGAGFLGMLIFFMTKRRKDETKEQKS